jgi:osmotically-inducible protein OsmY
MIRRTLLCAALGFAVSSGRLALAEADGLPATDQMLDANGAHTKADVDLTAEIRRSLLKDKRLSMEAQNVKIFTESGRVTLRGLVRSATERARVEADADRVVGNANVTDEIEVPH